MSAVRDVPGRLVPVNGTRLHVDEYGDPAAPMMLFVHGGPGQGSYDFSRHQGARLGRHVRLLAVDQRGTLFSDPLSPGEQVTETGMVDDLVALRETLEVESWILLGHSFGGRVSVRYALDHAEHVRGLVLENPSLDWTGSATALLTAALAILDETGAAETDEVRDLLHQGVPATTQAVRRQRELMDALGPRRSEVYFHQAAVLADLASALPSQSLPAEVRDRGDEPGRMLRDHEQLLEPLLPRLADLEVPALLISGLYDHVLDDDAIEVFNATVTEGDVRWFDESGHFCHIEEPDSYAHEIAGFVRDYC
jgi:proline iminopeptidase